MALNLNSLKNLSTSSEVTPIENIPSQMEALASMPTEIPKNTVNIGKESTCAIGPKISLFKLKKAAGIDSSSSVQEPMTISSETDNNQTSEELVSPEIKDTLLNITQDASVEGNTEAMISFTSKTGEIEQDQTESESIILVDEAQEIADQKQTIEEVTAPKEFFPKFQITDTMHLDEDLEDLITIKDSSAEPITPMAEEAIISEEKASIESIENIPNETIAAISIENEVQDTETSISTIKEAVLFEETPDDNHVMITPEYVAEVKTELSENRRAGFRFFTQHKTKILAGTGLLIFSGFAMIFFSDSLFSTKVQNSGKGNIQEIMKNTDTPMPIQNTEIPPKQEPQKPPMESNVPPQQQEEVIPPPHMENIEGYEMGRDYSITKNTKKNIRIKTDTGAIGTITP